MIRNFELKIRNCEGGQVALVVLLISAVVMTVGLATAKKTTVDTTVETNEEQLKQAFNAAESGIEYYLGTGKTNFTSIDNLSSAAVTVKNIGEGSTLNFGDYTLVNRVVSFWLSGHQGDGTIDLADNYGGSELSLCVDSGYGGALKVDYFYFEGGSYKVKRYGYNFSDNYVSGFVNGNQNAVQGGCVSGYREIDVGAPLGGVSPVLLAVKPLRTGTRIYLLGNDPSFPVQGVELRAVGTVGQSSTAVNQSLKVIRTYQMPGFLLDAITSYGDVLSN